MPKKNKPENIRHWTAEFAPHNHDACHMTAQEFSKKIKRTLRRQKNGNLFVESDNTRYIWSNDGSQYKGWASSLFN